MGFAARPAREGRGGGQGLRGSRGIDREREGRGKGRALERREEVCFVMVRGMDAPVR